MSWKVKDSVSKIIIEGLVICDVICDSVLYTYLYLTSYFIHHSNAYSHISHII